PLPRLPCQRIWVSPVEGMSDAAASDGEPIDDQEEESSDDRADQPRRPAGRTEESRREPPTEDRSADPQNDGDDDPARILPRHDELRHGARDQPDDDPHKESTFHRGPLLV